MKKNIIFLLIACLLLTACTSDKNVKKIMKAAKVKQKVAENIFETIKSIGYPQISSIKCNHHNTEYFFCSVENYDYFGNGGLMVSLTQEGVVKSITNYENYLYKDKSVIANFLDYSITVDDFIYLVKNSEEKTKKVLTSPYTAVFPKWQEWGASFKKDKITVSAYVDSQNSFGAMIRTPIKFVYNRRPKYNKEFEYSFNSAKIGNVTIK